MAVYKVVNQETGQAKLVEAKSMAGAIKVIAGSKYKAERASQDDLIKAQPQDIVREAS